MAVMSGTAEGRQLVESLDRWFHTDLGALVLEEELKKLGAMSSRLFGYYLLEVSLLCSHADYLQECPIRRRFRLSPCPSAGNQVLSMPEQLPVISDYIDAVILPHTLDFSADPRQVLREVERILIPEGKVVISGFNPWSLWGLWRAMPGAGRKLPWRGHFLSYSQVEDWLSLLGFDVEEVQTVLFRPPWKRAFLMRQALVMERLGSRFWPWLAGVYIIVASKRVSTLTPIRPRWRLQQSLRKASVQPVVNQINPEQDGVDSDAGG
ncbi:MAG TPA: methyltransferase domain-containing protein [Chromatiaceae bacterium]|nr:methyltransferase domain-containing protein [Chromatiaceae bacterium]